ncbi:MAG: amidase [Alphaproteobacteria bacterium]|nr:amidase [Alphaproteobacteria bacterium]
MTNSIERMTAVELLGRYRRKSLSPVEATRALLDRIERINPQVNAYCLVDRDAALKMAKASERRWRAGKPAGRLDGVPLGIKDLMLTKGWPTLRGSKTVDPNQPWDEDAPVIARLREAGAVFLGKTTTPEFGWKGLTDSALCGVPRNPWNRAMTAGGSSGGASAALAAGLGPLMTGSDGGGSIRIPCGFTGVYGLKPTFGRVPSYPASPFGTVSHIGPMTRSVADAALMLTVMAQPDWRDWYALPADGADYTKRLDKGVKGLRIGFSPDLGHAQVDPEIAASVAAGAKLFQKLGAKVEQVDPGGGTSVFTDCHAYFSVHWYAGAANLLARYTPAQKAMMDPGLVEIAEAGNRYSLLDYLAAVKRREELGMAMNKFHERYDLLLTPSLPIPAFSAGQETPTGSGMKRWTEWTPFTYPFNLTRQPASAVPCGLTRAGLPIGLQLVGPLHGEAAVLRASRAFERERPFAMPAMD